MHRTTPFSMKIIDCASGRCSIYSLETLTELKWVSELDPHFHKRKTSRLERVIQFTFDTYSATYLRKNHGPVSAVY